MITCTKCGAVVETKAKSTANWCIPCFKEYQRQYHKARRANKETDPYYARQREAQAKHYAKNADYYRDRARRDFHANKAAKLAYCAARYAEKKQVAWRARAATCLNQAIQSGRTTAVWWKYFRFSLDELRAHLEALFAPGMTWANRSEWHIDHIKPVCEFDPQELGDLEWQAMWALSNLQPLWPSENAEKGASSTPAKYRKYL